MINSCESANRRLEEEQFSVPLPQTPDPKTLEEEPDSPEGLFFKKRVYTPMRKMALFDPSMSTLNARSPQKPPTSPEKQENSFSRLAKLEFTPARTPGKPLAAAASTLPSPSLPSTPSTSSFFSNVKPVQTLHTPAKRFTLPENKENHAFTAPPKSKFLLNQQPALLSSPPKKRNLFDQMTSLSSSPKRLRFD